MSPAGGITTTESPKAIHEKQCFVKAVTSNLFAILGGAAIPFDRQHYLISAQIRAARALPPWREENLAAKSRVG
jgi:hypothetical protein